MTLAQITRAKNKVKLEDLGITHLRPKLAATGVMLLEVPGEDSADRADKLAQRLRDALSEHGC